MFLLTIGLLVITIVLYLLTWRYNTKKYMKNVPGPPPNFFLGNLTSVLFVPKHKLLDKLLDLTKQYGPNMKLFAGPVLLTLCTTDDSLVKHILSSHKLIDKSKFYGFLHSWLGTGLLTSTGIKWKTRRRMITPAFHFSVLNNFVNIFENVGNIFIEKLAKETDKNSVDVFPLVTLCTLDIICEAAMGYKLHAQTGKNSKYVKGVKTMCSIFHERLISPLHPLLYPLTLNYYKEKKTLKILHGHTEHIINKKIASSLPTYHDHNTNDENKKSKKGNLSFLDLILHSTIDGNPLSKLDIREEVDTFMFEGHDTTASAISFALHSLSINPRVQQKVYLEQKQMFNEDLKLVKPTTTQLNDMKYLEMVIKETLRLYPSVPLLARKFPDDEEFIWDGNLYPKGLNVLIAIYAMHRNPEYFSDPLTFLPERFEDSNQSFPFIFSPFSAGPRNCIGQKFAMLEMKSIISKVIRSFEILPAKPFEELKIISDIVLRSENGMCVSIKTRS